MTKSKSYFIRTFGCQMNVSDSERIAGWYEIRGYQRAEKQEEADEVVINTCSVRQTAEDRVYGLVNNLTKFKVQPFDFTQGQSSKCKIIIQSSRLKRPKIILTGCMLRYPLRFLREKLPSVDNFKKINEFNSLNYWTEPKRESKVHAWVPITEGCDNFCSYCVVPYARGPEKSRPLAEIVCEVKELAKRGYKEITLLGQNVNSYGRDAKMQRCKDAKKKNSETLKLCNFAALLARLNDIPGIEKISFLTSNPWDLNDEIIEAMSLPKIDRYLHLPVQSGDDEILKKMNRRYSVKQYLKLVEKIRRKIPDIKIGTDIIVGFPGETEEQFQNTVLLCTKVGFCKAYVTMYSPRLQTAAFKLKDDIPHREKKRRWKILDELINQ